MRLALTQSTVLALSIGIASANVPPPNLLDVALADIYLQPDAQPGTTMPIEVTVQNRGTNWFSDAQLEVFIGEAEPVSFVLGSLGPGQTTTRKVFTQIPTLDSDEMLHFRRSRHAQGARR